MSWPHLILLVIIPLYSSSFPQSLDSFIHSRTLSGKGFPVFHLHCLSVTCYLYKPGRFFWRPTYREPWVVGSFTEFSKTKFLTVIVSLLPPLHHHPLLPYATPSGLGGRGIDLDLGESFMPLVFPHFLPLQLFILSIPSLSSTVQLNFSLWAWGLSSNCWF